jgi:hypothetical protein
MQNRFAQAKGVQMVTVRNSLYGLVVAMYGYAIGVRSLEEAVQINVGILGFIVLLLFLPPHLRVKAAGYMILGVALGIGVGRLIPTWDWVGFAAIAILAIVLTRGR